MNSTSSILIIVLILFNSCHVKDDNSNILTDFNDTSSTFKKEIPTYTDGPNSGDTDYVFRELREDASQLKLDYIENGFDQLQIRVWLGHSMAVERHLIILKFYDSKWMGYRISFTKGDDHNVAKQKIRKVAPQSGWTNFIRALNEMKIFQLLEQTNVNDHSGCGGADGMSYYYEIATTKKYRFLYNCYPDHRFTDFASYLEEEFEFEYLKE